MSQTNLCQHLVKNIDNTDENRDYVRVINKIAKNSDSRWRLKIRYRKPKDGNKYSWGGGLKRENADAFSVYLEDKTPYQETGYWKLRTMYHKLLEENESLKRKVSFYENPYSQWSGDEIEEELFNVKEDMVERFIDNNNHSGVVKELDDDQLRNKYNQLVEVLDYDE